MLANFVEETTTSIAGTNGDGAVTLAVKAPYNRFSQSGLSGTRLVQYFIEDTTAANGKWEKGIGSHASGVLTRSTPRETWDGSTFDDTNPSPLAFGSTPTSGNIRIRIAPAADSFMQAMPYFNASTLTSGELGRGLTSQHLFWTGNGAGRTFSTATEYYTPYLWGAQADVTQVGVYCNTSAASTGAKIGLYDVGSNGLPGPNIALLAEIATTSTGFLTTTASPLPLKVPPGWYWLGLMLNSATPQLLGVSGNVAAMPPPMGRYDGYGNACFLSKTAENSYATGLPSGTPAGTYTAVSPGAAQFPLIWLRPR